MYEEYQIYALAAVAIGGFIANRVIEYRNKRKIAPILRSIEGNLERLIALNKKLIVKTK